MYGIEKGGMGFKGVVLEGIKEYVKCIRQFPNY